MMQYHRRSLDDREVHRRWIDPRLYAVRVADLQAYLAKALRECEAASNGSPAPQKP